MAEGTIDATAEKLLHDTIEKLQQENIQLKDEKAALEAVNTELVAKVEDLTKPAAIAEAVAPAKPLAVPTKTFQVGKKTYAFITPVFLHNGVRVVAEEALADSSLLEDLVKRKSGVIQPVK